MSSRKSHNRRGPGRPPTDDKRVSRRVGLSESEEERILAACRLRGKEFSPLARELLLDWANKVGAGRLAV